MLLLLIVEPACTRWAQNPRVSAEHLINDMQSIRDSATKASTNITKLADNVSTWWTNLDPVQHASPSPEEHGRQSAKAQVGLAFYLQTPHPKTWQSKILLMHNPALECDQGAVKNCRSCGHPAI